MILISRDIGNLIWDLKRIMICRLLKILDRLAIQLKDPLIAIHIVSNNTATNSRVNVTLTTPGYEMLYMLVERRGEERRGEERRGEERRGEERRGEERRGEERRGEERRGEERRGEERRGEERRGEERRGEERGGEGRGGEGRGGEGRGGEGTFS